MGFAGFSPKLQSFLTDLRDHNTKEWFEAHRADYDANFMGAAKDFVAAMGEPLRQIDPALKAEPRLNGSIRRIHRDTRFSKDKTPYTAQLHLIFWLGDHPLRGPGFHLVIGADHVGAGAGHWGFAPEELARFRDEVSQNSGADDLQSVLDGMTADPHWQLSPPALKRIPKGFDGDGPGADFLRHKGLVIKSEGLDGAAMFGPGATEFATDLAKYTYPLLKWLMAHVYK